MSDAVNLVTPIKDDIESATSFDKERVRLHQQMLSSLSHDLKTPLASIIGSLEVYERMRQKLPEEKKQALIHVALQESYRLDNFITNILDMAKFENGMVKARRETTNINALLRDCLTKLSNRLESSTVRIAPTTVPVEVITDPVLLSRAICLVLDNAVKYSGAAPVIDVTFDRNNAGEGIIQIRDNGAGIPDGKMEAIFLKYTRFAKEDQQNAGTGLGLVIGREILRLLGGDLTADNHAEGGAVFTLRFLAA